MDSCLREGPSSVEDYTASRKLGYPLVIERAISIATSCVEIVNSKPLKEGKMNAGSC